MTIFPIEKRPHALSTSGMLIELKLNAAISNTSG